ncbi:hypothetical protein Ga0609869_001653 [Rhodovulum iodosum]|uniref:DUF4386 domain-containing protein n=1 Tax=Rhodovulum iodosum TaxID=68291 RepID=A0ABV3XSI5_9RHOB|nr:DUF4386 domain-containing protein [Rhodovulum robiginosum]RSK30621.1 DUF4386 domain-containing protein [Rhodovulum robiginosum]
MTRALAPETAVKLARWAGFLYLVVIVCGLLAELAVRQALIVPGDAAATAANIGAAEGRFRLGLAADAAMGLADAGLGVLLFVLLRPVGAILSLAALVFRLAQTAIVGMTLILSQAALLALDGVAGDGGEGLAALLLAAHGLGYDTGLAFFGVACGLLGLLVWRSGYLPRWLGALLAAAGAVYLTGSALRLVAPGLSGAFAPAYALPLLAEAAFCLWLLIRGVDRAGWARAVSAPDRNPPR